MASSIFISHAAAIPIVDFVAEKLEAHLPGAETWIDAKIGGGKWEKQIAEALDHADAFVLIATPTVLGSIYAGFELGYIDKRLGDDHVFLLRCGLDNKQLQIRPPLGVFQAWDSEDADSLRGFFERIGETIGIDLKAESADFDEMALHMSRLVETELHVKDDSPIAAPKIISAGQLRVPILPKAGKEALQALKDIDTIESHLDMFDKHFDKDSQYMHLYFNEAKKLCESRAKAGVPEGNLRSRFERLAARLDEAQDKLLSRV